MTKTINKTAIEFANKLSELLVAYKDANNQLEESSIIQEYQKTLCILMEYNPHLAKSHKLLLNHVREKKGYESI